MAGSRGGSKSNHIIRPVPMVRFIKTVRYPILYQKDIQPHITGSNSLVNCGVCALLINLDTPFSGVLLWVMWIRSAGVNILLAQDL